MYSYTLDPLTKKVYGNYGGNPNGSPRRIRPMLLACIHVTDNTATAQQERDNVNRPANSTLRSAHDYVNQDGSVVAAINPVRFCAWSNGDIKSPNTALALVKTVLTERAKGFNPNELFAREIECVGKPSTLPITREQEETLAQLIAQDSIYWAIPISRATVGTHADINSETRSRCAWVPASREPALKRIMLRANAIRSDWIIGNFGPLKA